MRSGERQHRDPREYSQGVLLALTALGLAIGTLVGLWVTR